MTYLLGETLREAVYVHSYYTRLAQSALDRADHLRGLGYTDASESIMILRYRLIETKKQYRKIIMKLINDDPFMQTCRNVRRLNGTTVAELFYYIDISKSDTVSQLWAYCGLGVFSGYSQQVNNAMNATTSTWNPNVYRTAGRVRSQLIRRDGPYRPVFEKRKAYELDRGQAPIAASHRALRYTSKRWLKHVWIAGRTIFNLPTNLPHMDDRDDLESYGWDIGATGEGTL